MKKMLLITLVTITSYTGFSQVETAQVGAEFQAYSHNGTSGPSDYGIETYSSGTVKGSQFFYPTWSKGSVTTLHNETLSTYYSFLYDKVRQLLFMKWKDSALVLLADKPSIKSFTLDDANGNAHNFVKASLYNPKDNVDFYEVLSSNKNYTFLKLIKTKFVKADYTDMAKVKQGDIQDEWVDNISYFISYNNGIPQPVTLKEKSLEKVMVPVKDKIIAYFNNTSSDNGVDENYVSGLVQSLN